MALCKGITVNGMTVKIWTKIKVNCSTLQCFHSLQPLSTCVGYSKHKCMYCNDEIHNNVYRKPKGVRMLSSQTQNGLKLNYFYFIKNNEMRFNRPMPSYVCTSNDGRPQQGFLKAERLSPCLNKKSFSSRVNDNLIDSEKCSETFSSDIENNLPGYLHFHPSCKHDTLREITSSFQVVKDYLSKDEEEILMKEVEPHLKRLQYEFDHWDDAIHGFRETERSRWGKASSAILSRMRQYAFPEGENQIAQVHVLDLAKTGVIKPHVDSIRFCGNIICGLCLLSDAVMRLVHTENKDQIIDIMLPRRALYIMKEESRYKYTHEVLGEKESFFNTIAVPRERRVSIMCRNNPKEEECL